MAFDETVVKQAQILSERILTLNPENQKLMNEILEQFLISETASKLGVRPTDIKQILKNKQ
ncbi:hypothetical protein [Paraclostridium sordellii]|uniref:hypothetical protein n=1 Tax=Paraclostridium sordellii TaxID=1505 RepID=UPI0022E8EA40|nr:hypothetical protein [Paeniclostridium sordellii]